MAKAPKQTVVHKRIAVNKKTSQGLSNIKKASMNKKTKANFKPYRGQGKP
jgi:hypothetical protein